MNKAEYLAELIGRDLRSAPKDDHFLLPTVRGLAARWGTSQETVIAALRELEKRGIIAKSPGSNRYIPAGLNPLPINIAPQLSQSRYREIASELKKDVISGLYTFQTGLPLLCELRTRFCCTHATLQRAISLLVSQGILEKTGRTTSIRRPASSSGSRIHVAGVPRFVQADNHAALQLIRGIEEQIQRLGWNPYKAVEISRDGAVKEPPEHEVAAYVHLGFWPTDEWIKRKEQHTRIPVVRVNPFGGGFSRKRRSRSPVINLSGDIAAGSIGEHLLSLGHRHIALICPYSTTELWVQGRIKGLKDLYEIAGQDERSFKLILLEPAGSQKPHDWSLMVRERIHALREGVRKADMFVPQIIKNSLDTVYSIQTQGEMLNRLEPRLRELLDDKKITAWVGINDITAGLAYSFLRRNRIRIPDQISLAGFDNSPLSLNLGITTYDFDYLKAGRTAINALAFPKQLPVDRYNRMELIGYLVKRFSTARAAFRTS